MVRLKEVRVVRAYLVRGGGWAWAGHRRGKLNPSPLSVATRSLVGNFGPDMPTGSVAVTRHKSRECIERMMCGKCCSEGRSG